MATVRAFVVAGLKLWFYSNDHEPPHFHAKRAGEWELRVYFLRDSSAMIESVWVEKRPSPRLLRTLVDLAAERRGELLAEWERVQGDGNIP